ncbi:MAG: META domain-containing protein [Halomonadaceae bacterium]|nr:MAG: META domain-containing protein [Halomonadaceae bacterium]
MQPVTPWLLALAVTGLVACTSSQTATRESDSHSLTPERLSAQGNEPFWHLQVENGEATLQRLGKDTVQLPVQHTRQDSSTRVASETVEPLLEARFTTALCHDTMTGMPYPQHVSLRFQDRQYQGCGGDPAQLLQGVEWQVQQLGGQPVQDLGLTLQFTPEGRVSGHSGCNRFFGQYQLTGEGLTIGSLGSTKMACPGDPMTVEAHFLEQLQQVTLFDLKTDNNLQKLRLNTGGHPITALPR